MNTGTGKIPNIQVENIGNKKRPHYVVKGFIELTEWTGYFLYDDTYKLIKEKVVTHGRISLWIDSKIEADGSFHISPKQEKAYFHLVAHQEKIKHSILENLKRAFPRLLANEYAAWEHTAPYFTAISDLTPEFDFKNYIGPVSISIGEDVKDELAYVTWDFKCRWDMEHGFGVITHGDRVIDIGPEADIWKIDKDNGTYDQKQKEYSKKEWTLPKQKKWWQLW